MDDNKSILGSHTEAEEEILRFASDLARRQTVLTLEDRIFIAEHLESLLVSESDYND